MSLAASYCIIRDIEGEGTILLLCLRWRLPYHTGALSSLLLLYYSGIVAADDPLEVRHAAVAELDYMPIQDQL